MEVPDGGISCASLRYFHDDDVEIFVNGEPLLTRSAYTTEYEDLSLAPDQVSLFRPGRNVIAMHCMNVTGPQYVDIGITAELAEATNSGSDSTQVAENREGTLERTGD